MTKHDASPQNRSTAWRWLGIAIGLALPTLITWGYFVLAAEYSSGLQQSTYLIVKVVQFAFPLLWVFLVLRERVTARSPSWKGLPTGAIFSVVVVAAGWAVFAVALRDSALFIDASAMILDKLATFGVDAVWKYALLAAFYSLVHSLLEEYYWRWFVFGQLRRMFPLAAAIAISAIAFASHHVIVLALYFGPWSSTTWLLSSAIVVGGAFWAWLYEKSDSLLGPWLSHLLIDAGIFWIGFDLVREALR